MYQILGIMAGILLMGYAFFLLGKLGRFYSEIFSWNISKNIKLPLRFSLAVIAGIFCFDIWSVTAMVTLHLAGFFFLSDIVNILLRHVSRKSLPYWKKVYDSGLLPIVLLGCLMLYGSMNMNHVVQTAYTITTEKSIRQEGYRIAFLSDIHYGTVQNKSVLESSIEEINELEPDIVILGGDIVEEGTSREDMQEVFYQLGLLDATYGVFFIYGNHDRQADASSRTYSDQELIAAIQGNGITILEDTVQLLNGELLLIGRSDASWNGDNTRKEICSLIQNGQEDSFLLTLDHQPLEAEENDCAGVDLMLSGHTHAGQLFPVGYLTELCGGMNYGLYQTGSCQSIISSGFAGWGYGIRTQEHCEYVIIDILPEAG